MQHDQDEKGGVARIATRRLGAFGGPQEIRYAFFLRCNFLSGRSSGNSNKDLEIKQFKTSEDLAKLRRIV